MTDWGDVVARARGLTSQLLAPAEWRDLARSTDLTGVAARLAARGWHLPPAAVASASPATIELAVRRRAGARLRLLARWAGDRATMLAPLYDDEDLRSLRAIIRGAAAGMPAADRLHGLLPTPALPMRALEQLARAADASVIAAQLAVWRHPFAGAFAGAAHGPHPDLFRLDVAVVRAFAAHAVAAARHADDPMRRFVRRTVDLGNLWTALALADRPADVVPAELFVAGGDLIRADDLKMAKETRSPAALTGALKRRVARSPLAAALELDAGTPEDRALDALVAECRAAALRAPLSTAPIIAFALRQRVEVRSLLHLVWGMALGEPREAIAKAIGVAA